MMQTTLSDLEGVVLGLIWSEGPCTAYAVRRTVHDSLTAQWSGSAGAIYPAVARLEQRGWICGKARATGRRQSRQLEITRQGIEMLGRWLGPPLDELTTGIPIDPLRSRLRFLGVLSPAKRRAFLLQARQALTRQLAEVERDWRERRRQDCDPFAVAMARGVLLMLRARLKWLDEVSGTVEKPSMINRPSSPFAC